METPTTSLSQVDGSIAVANSLVASGRWELESYTWMFNVMETNV